MDTMKAWTHIRAGPASNVLTQSTVPRPHLTSPTQVLIKVSYCALNPAGSIVMQLLPFIFRASPAIPEMDFSGTIMKTGSDVPDAQNLAPGTEVFGSIPLRQHVKSSSGALAEYIVVDYTAVVAKPDCSNLSEVAGLGIAGATALELIKAAHLEEGDSVLVSGAGGGIGHLVVQMCREKVGLSGKVVAICSHRSSEWVPSLSGCGHQANNSSTRSSSFQIVDRDHQPLLPYLTQSFASTPFDAVIDAVGIQSIFDASPAFLAENKSYVTVGPRAFNYTYLSMLGTIRTMAKNMLWPRILGGTPRRYVQVAATSNLAALEELANITKMGKLKVRVGMILGWDDVLSAYDMLMAGRASGKIVVDVETCG